MRSVRRRRDAAPGPEEKLCPYCAEVIRAAAIKCRYCGSDLPPLAEQTEPAADETAEDTADETADETAEQARPAEAVEPAEPVAEPVAGPEHPGALGGSEQPEQPERRPRSGPGWLVTAGLVLALCVAGVGLWAVGRHADHSDTAKNGQLASPGARAAIMAEAVRLTSTVMSYDASHSASDIAASERLMTPHARKEYEASLPAAKDRRRQAQLHITVTATIGSLTNPKAKPVKGQPGGCTPGDCAVSLLSATKDTARVLLFVNQSAQAKGGKNTVLSQTWETVDLVQRGGTWIIDDMQSSS